MSPLVFILWKEWRTGGHIHLAMGTSIETTRNPPQQPGAYTMATGNTPHHIVHREHIMTIIKNLPW